MSVLSDGSIRRLIASGDLGIDPYEPDRIQPASIDLLLGYTFQVFRKGEFAFIDPKEPSHRLMEMHHLESENECFVLHPGEFVLGRTQERVSLSRWLTARLDGKSSLGRLGLVIHSTAGWIDPGFEGTITLELSNDAQLPIKLYPNMPIGQLSFMRMDRPVEKPYQGKYQGQTDPTVSKMHENFVKNPRLPGWAEVFVDDHPEIKLHLDNLSKTWWMSSKRGGGEVRIPSDVILSSQEERQSRLDDMAFSLLDYKAEASELPLFEDLDHEDLEVDRLSAYDGTVQRFYTDVTWAKGGIEVQGSGYEQHDADFEALCELNEEIRKRAK